MMPSTASAPPHGSAPRKSQSEPRVTFLSPSAQMGGAERVLLDMIASLRAAHAGQRIALIVNGYGPLVDGAVALDARVTVLPFPPALADLGDAGAGAWRKAHVLSRAMIAAPGVGQYVRELRRALLATAPDVVHSNGAKMHLLAAFACGGTIPLLWHMHDYLGQRPFMRRALRANVSRCSAVIAISKSVAWDARAALGAAVAIHTLPNAVDLERLASDGPLINLDALAGMQSPPDGTVRIGLVATFAKWKGHEVFFRALAMLPEAVPLRAYVVGGPLYETRGSQHTMKELRHLADAHGLAGRVGFTGHVTDAAAAMRWLDVVVHASAKPEPFGLVVAEAMACGRAVIASGAGGVLEFVDAERNALVHAPGDAEALAHCMVRLVGSERLRLQLGAEGSRTARLMFDRTRLASALTPIYEQAVQAGRP